MSDQAGMELLPQDELLADQVDISSISSKALHRLQLWSSDLLRNLVLANWLMLAVWVLGLPLWSQLLNDMFWDFPTDQSPKGLCTVPPEAMTCFGGYNFTELARAAGRGAGCSCGQGALGEALCPVYSGGYQISGLIATSFGTAVTGSLSGIPLVATWWIHGVVVEQVVDVSLVVHTVLWWSLAGFQAFYMLFLMLPVCVWNDAHINAALLFIVVGGVYWGLLSYLCWQKAHTVQVARVIGTVSVVGFLAFSFGLTCFKLFMDRRIQWPYGFWLGQSIGILCGLGTAPAVLIFGRVTPDSKYARTGTSSSVGRRA